MKHKQAMPGPAPIELSDEERAALDAKRRHDAAVKACAEEIGAVLAKYGLALQIVGNPQIVLVPRG